MLTLFAADPLLGRLDYDSLSDQALMEMLFANLDESSKKSLQDSNGFFKDISEWRDIRVADDRVVTVTPPFFSKFDETQFPFEFIPSLVTEFLMDHVNLHGVLDTGVLPAALLEFDVSRNLLHGTIDFKRFPRNLQRILISSNALCGSVALDDLPDTLSRFVAEKNKFTGEISLNALPAQMKGLNLSKNQLSGSISIESLPETIEYFCLNDNEFVGDFRLMALPPNLDAVHIYNNSALSGTAVIRGTSKKMYFHIMDSCITAVIDENGSTHTWEDAILEYWEE